MALIESSLKLKKGDEAINFNLKGIDNKNYSLDDFKGAKALLVIFMCNHCPYVKAKTDVMKQLHEKYKDKGLSVIGINSNDTKAFPEDSFEDMKRFAEEKGLKFPYVIDETQDIAKAYGASCTPDPFLFDKNRKLVYHGRFDNALSPGEAATKHDMDKVINAVLNNKQVEKGFLPSLGCSIKWK